MITDIQISTLVYILIFEVEAEQQLESDNILLPAIYLPKRVKLYNIYVVKTTKETI